MKRYQHPEYELYQQATVLVERSRQAIAAWLADGRPWAVPEYDWHWTPERAKTFIQELVRFFAAYNRVLWQQFAYCAGCGGGCCVLYATQVTWFDGLALALQDQSLPVLAESSGTTSQDCIYLAAGGCSWPHSWKPVKCALFYCALGDNPAPIAAALLPVFNRYLPDALRQYEVVAGHRLAHSLSDPVMLSDRLHQALARIFADPFLARYLPRDGQQSPPVMVTKDREVAVLDALIDETRLFLSQAVDAVGNQASDQFLADLEMVEWIVQGRPAQAQSLLAELYQRYAGASAPNPGRPPLLEYRMRQQLLQLWQNWS